ncbi:MAG: hypothetical protein IJ506_02390 [Clostridia bacterium]|nr:hypothetical protein [Clostridia bacterium]
MTVFAWILFIISALIALGTLYEWFAEGRGLFAFIGSAACVVYLIFYLFITPFNVYVTWGYFIGVCLFVLGGLLLRKLGYLIGFGVYVLFFALVLFA